ncbi:LEC14B protein-like protein [Tanacetum coccineum]
MGVEDATSPHVVRPLIDDYPFAVDGLEIRFVIKPWVWERRSFRSKGKSAGIPKGHLEGMAFLNSRNDGRYFISNGKKQTILGYPENVI